jgi:hypothetical protein
MFARIVSVGWRGGAGYLSRTAGRVPFMQIGRKLSFAVGPGQAARTLFARVRRGRVGDLPGEAVSGRGLPGVRELRDAFREACADSERALG